MNGCDDFLIWLESQLPDVCSVSDLVKAKIFLSPQCASHARKAGKTPSYFKLGQRIMYPRKAVIQWLQEQKYETNLPKEHKDIFPAPSIKSRMATCC